MRGVPTQNEKFSLAMESKRIDSLAAVDLDA
jgi:hypothetical protein